MLLCKIISDGSFGELWLFELILESVVRFSSRLNVQSVRMPNAQQSRAFERHCAD